MSDLTELDVKHIAKLSNLVLTEDQIKKFRDQLSKIVTHVSVLDEVNTKDIEPTSQTTGLTNVFRDDEFLGENLTQDEALSGAIQKYNGYFVVSQILDKP